MRFFFVLISLLAIGFNSYGQDFKSTTFHATGGFSWPDVGPINALLQNPDSCRTEGCYNTFRNSFFSFGLGVEGIQERIVWQADAYLFAIANPGGRNDAFMQNILQYYYATFRLGYVVGRKIDGDYPFVVYPFVGGGGGLGQLRLSGNGRSRFARYNTSGYLLDVGLALNTYSRLPDNNQSFKFGGSIGYYIAPESAWSLDNTSSATPVPISPQGVYIRLCLGIGTVDN
jgi:hypothetical protein